MPVPIPVSAAVGLYFGVLSGATSSQVPQITNGRFDPVIVAGVVVHIEAYAVATAVLESYQPIHLTFEAGVSISLSVKVLFFHITSGTPSASSSTPSTPAPPTAATVSVTVVRACSSAAAAVASTRRTSITGAGDQCTW